MKLMGEAPGILQTRLVKKCDIFFSLRVLSEKASFQHAPYFLSPLRSTFLPLHQACFRKEIAQPGS